MPRQAFFDRAAGCWDSMHPAPAQEDAILRGLARLGPLAGRTVIDVGCGTGVLMPHLLARVGETGRVVGLDFSAEMIARARALHPDPRITWVARGVLDSALRPGEAHAVLCYNTFPHLTPTPAVLEAWAGWLAPGGLALIWHGIGREQLNAIHQRVGGPIAGDVLPAADALAEQLRRAGFVVHAAEEDAASYLVLAARQA